MHEVLDDFVPMRCTLLARENADGVHVCPARFDTLAAGTSSAAREVQAEAPLTVLAVCADVELRDNEHDLHIRCQIEEIAVQFLEALVEVDRPRTGDVVRQQESL